MLSDSDYEAIAEIIGTKPRPARPAESEYGFNDSDSYRFIERVVGGGCGGSHGIQATQEMLEQFGVVVSKTARIRPEKAQAFDVSECDEVIRIWITEITHETVEFEEDVGGHIKSELEQCDEFDYADIDSVEATETFEETRYTVMDE